MYNLRLEVVEFFFVFIILHSHSYQFNRPRIFVLKRDPDNSFVELLISQIFEAFEIPDEVIIDTTYPNLTLKHFI
jgi:hypothetical protein